MGVSSEVLEHTAEVRLRVAGPTLGALLAEAGRALAAVELDGPPPAPAGAWRTIEVRSTDRDALLVDWLNELVYLAETECWVPSEFEIEAVGPTELRARARGVPLDAAPARVKAATFHGLRIAETAGGLEAEVILDV
jgi:SHS2 domain-containing protein